MAFTAMDLTMGPQPLPSMPTPQFPQMPGMAKPTGMFGAGGVGRNILGMIGDFLMARAGMQPIYAPTMAQRQQLMMKAALEKQERQQEFQDQRKAHQQDRQFDINNPLPQQPATPGSMDALRAEYLDPSTSPERKAQLEPIVLQPQLQMVPGLGLVSIPRTPQQTPTTPVGKLTPYNPGGPSPSGSGGFPYQ